MTMRTIAVTTRKQWKDFYGLRRKIYRNDPAVVYPLKIMERQLLDVDAHPFFETASREVFICYDSKNQPVGRIVAIKDDLHNDFNKDKLGFLASMKLPIRVTPKPFMILSWQPPKRGSKNAAATVCVDR